LNNSNHHEEHHKEQIAPTVVPQTHMTGSSAYIMMIREPFQASTQTLNTALKAYLSCLTKYCRAEGDLRRIDQDVSCGEDECLKATISPRGNVLLAHPDPISSKRTSHRDLTDADRRNPTTSRMSRSAYALKLEIERKIDHEQT
jgi:hypothetical protein